MNIQEEITYNTDITDNMVRSFKRRTYRHKKAVQKYGSFLKKFLNQAQRIVFNSYLTRHDDSKFDIEELKAYILFTWVKQNPENCYMSDDLKKQFEIAVQHHYKNNSHHPEHFENLEDMNKVCLTEMVADWAAMSDEFNNSIIDWHEKCMEKYNFTDEQERFIAQLVYHADKCLRKEVKNYK